MFPWEIITKRFLIQPLMAFLPLDRLHVIKLRQLLARKVDLPLVYFMAIRKKVLYCFVF